MVSGEDNSSWHCQLAQGPIVCVPNLVLTDRSKRGSWVEPGLAGLPGPQGGWAVAFGLTSVDSFSRA